MCREIGHKFGIQRRTVPISLLQMEGQNVEVAKRRIRVGTVSIPWVIKGPQSRGRSCAAAGLDGIAANLACTVQVEQ